MSARQRNRMKGSPKDLELLHNLATLVDEEEQEDDSDELDDELLKKLEAATTKEAQRKQQKQQQNQSKKKQQQRQQKKKAAKKQRKRPPNKNKNSSRDLDMLDQLSSSGNNNPSKQQSNGKKKNDSSKNTNKKNGNDASIRDGRNSKNYNKKQKKKKKKNSDEDDRAYLQISPDDLDETVERQRVFKVRRRQQQRQKRTAARKWTFFRPKESWDQVRGSVDMVAVAPGTFRFQYKPGYQRVEEDEFPAAVASGRPEQLVALIQKHGYHIGAMLQLSHLCGRTSQHELATDLLQRVLYFCELNFAPTFSVTNRECRLPFKYEENQGFHIALFRYANSLGRRGLCRTAFEYCRLALNLDPTDPLELLLVLDFFGVRAKCLQLMRAYYSRWTSKVDGALALEYYPNWRYNMALMERDEEQMRSAIAMFPECLPKLLTGSAASLASSVTPACVIAPSDALRRVTDIFCARSADLYAPRDAQEFLRRCLEGMPQWTDLEQSLYETGRNAWTSSVGAGRATTGTVHSMLSEDDLADVLNTIPDDVVQAAMLQVDAGALDTRNLRGGNRAAMMRYFVPMNVVEEEEQRATVHAPTANALALFFHSLLPWNETPNAPPLEDTDGDDDRGYAEALRDVLGLHNIVAGGNEDQPLEPRLDDTGWSTEEDDDTTESSEE